MPPQHAPTAVVADDERLLREQIVGRLKDAWPELAIVGEAANGAEAVALVQSLEPDIVFLDIRMSYAKEDLNKLPMEFAVEAQKLLAISLEGSVG